MAALRFGETNTDEVDHGSAAGLDNMAQCTVMVWLKPVAVTNANRAYVNKSDGSTGWSFIQRTADGTTFTISIGRATTAQAAISTSVLTAGAWQFLAGTCDITNGGPKVYRGTLSSVVVDVTNGTPEDGAGAQDDDAAHTLEVGNLLASLSANADIAWVAVYNRDMPLAEIMLHRLNPHRAPGCKLFSIYDEGSRLVTDLSGFGNHGLITGAVYVPDDDLTGIVTLRDDLGPLPIRRKLFDVVAAGASRTPPVGSAILSGISGRMDLGITIPTEV